MNRRLSRHRWLSGAMFWLFLMASLAPAVSRMLAGADPAGHMQHAHHAHHGHHGHHEHQAHHAHHAGHADHAAHASARQLAQPVSGHPDQATGVTDDEGAAPASLFTLSDMLDCCPLCAVMGDRLAPVLQVMPLFAVRASVRAPPRGVVAAVPVSTLLLIPQPRAPPSFRPALSGQARVFSSRSLA